MKAIRLRTEYLNNPIGLGTRTPRLFWNCEGGTRQTAFEIDIRQPGNLPEKSPSQDNHWSSGKIPGSSMHYDLSSDSPWNLSSRSCIYWRIRLWDENDAPGEWSEEAFFELGLLEEKDWSAKWIAGNYRSTRTDRPPVDCFRKIFDIDPKKHSTIRIRKARLYAVACGIYEVHLNGIRVGDAVLTPGATDPTKRIQVQTYDVTTLVQGGNNEITAELAGGWYKTYLCSDSRSARYGTSNKLLLQLELTFEDGTVTTIGTDRTWEWSNNGPVRFADNKMGEVIDARMTPDYSGHAKETTHPVPLVPSDNVLIKKQESFHPSLIRTPSGKTVLDFVQNLAGFVSFDVTAKAGDTITLFMGELLENGEFTQRNIDPDAKHQTPFQKVEYTCKEGRNQYETRFAIFGFRYVLVETSVPFEAKDFTATAVYSDMENTLDFDSDHPLLNRLVEATRWSAKNNSADVPTDCPTRERVGWTGDAQIFVNTASYLFDYAAFGRKYCRDLSDAQHRNGSYTQCAPRCAMNRFMNILDASAGWADAGILIPYRLWKRYGDDRILREHYSHMAAYGNFLIRRCGKKSPKCKRPSVPKDLQKYLVMSGMSYGEWLEPKEAVPFSVQEIGKPHVEESTAYTAYSLRLLAEIAGHLGQEKDAERFRMYEQGCTRAYQALVQTPEYSLDTDRQAKLVRPLYMNLLDEKTREEAKQRLLLALSHYNWRVGTGFLSTPFLLFVLEDIGIDYAYRLLENEEMPGWLAMPKNDATTIWENWEGPFEENPASLDHYSKGAVCEWIFSEMSGIQVDGENHFIIAPHPGGSIRHAACRYQSIYGTVFSEWTIKDDKTTYNIGIPANTTAEVKLPGEAIHTLSAGKYHFETAMIQSA